MQLFKVDIRSPGGEEGVSLSTASLSLSLSPLSVFLSLPPLSLPLSLSLNLSLSVFLSLPSVSLYLSVCLSLSLQFSRASGLLEVASPTKAWTCTCSQWASPQPDPETTSNARWRWWLQSLAIFTLVKRGHSFDVGVKIRIEPMVEFLTSKATTRHPMYEPHLNPQLGVQSQVSSRKSSWFSHCSQGIVSSTRAAAEHRIERPGLLFGF